MRQSAVRRDNRYSARIDVKVDAMLREMGSSTRFDVRLQNLSLTGFSCATLFRLRPDQQVVIVMPGLGPLDARVVWSDGDRYGCELGRALHVAVFDHVVAKYRVE